jgi:two-component system response regulator AlgR
MEALERSTSLNRLQLSALQAANDTRRIHLCARTYKGMRLINVKDIRYLQADQKYVTVRDEQQEVIVDETLRELEQEFADIFIRVHRNALVARKHIVGLEKGVTGQIVMRLDGVAETVDISRRHLPAVRKILKNI